MKLLKDLFKLTEEDEKDDVESDATPDISPEEDEPVDNVSAEDRPTVDEVDPEAPVEEPTDDEPAEIPADEPHDEENVDDTVDQDDSGTADADEIPVEDVGSVAADQGFVKSKKEMYAFGKTRPVTLLTKNEALGGLDITYQYVINPQTGAWKLMACLEGQSEQDMVEFDAGEDPSSLIANLKKKHKITAHQAVDKLKPPADAVVKDKEEGEPSDESPEAVDEAAKDSPAVAKWKEKQFDNGATHFKKDKFNTGNIYLVALTTNGREVARIRLDKLVKESSEFDDKSQYFIARLKDLAAAYKKHEAGTDSVPSPPDTTKFRATRSGMIQFERNVHADGRNYSYFLKIGSNVKKDVRDEIIKKFVDDFKHEGGSGFPGTLKTPDGVIYAGHVSGTNWGGIGLNIEKKATTKEDKADSISRLKAEIWDLDRAIMTLEKGGKGMHQGRIDAMKLRNKRDELKDKLKELESLKEAFIVEGAHDYGRSFPVDKFPTVNDVMKHIRANAGHSSDPYSDENQLSRVELERVNYKIDDENKLYDKMLDNHQKWDPLLIDKFKKNGKEFWLVAGWLAE